MECPIKGRKERKVLLPRSGRGTVRGGKGATALFPLRMLIFTKPVRDGGPIEGAGRHPAQPSCQRGREMFAPAGQSPYRTWVVGEKIRWCVELGQGGRERIGGVGVCVDGSETGSGWRVEPHRLPIAGFAPRDHLFYRSLEGHGRTAMTPWRKGTAVAQEKTE